MRLCIKTHFVSIVYIIATFIVYTTCIYPFTCSLLVALQWNFVQLELPIQTYQRLEESQVSQERRSLFVDTKRFLGLLNLTKLSFMTGWFLLTGFPVHLLYVPCPYIYSMYSVYELITSLWIGFSPFFSFVGADMNQSFKCTVFRCLFMIFTR